MPTTTTESGRSSSGRAAALVGAGILISRIVGLVRQRVISHYFGITTAPADAWAAGFRIPNLLQNLFGEGALSASLIPVYAGLLAQKRHKDADTVVGVVGALLALAVSVLVLVGVVVTPWVVRLVAPGFDDETRALTVTVVRVLFPGTGLLVMSAWCLGILNSHHRFLLSYTAPVAWSVTMIGALLWFGGSTDLSALVIILAWASVIGSALQFLVQVPSVLRLAPHLTLRAAPLPDDVWRVIRNFGPTVLTRGVVQLSVYIGTIIASWLPTGAMAAMTNAQTLYTLPISLFGMSISSAELPAMSATVVSDGAAFDTLRRRLNSGLRRIAFFVVPSAMLFFALGDVAAAALFQTGRFTSVDAVYVWTILAGSAIGLLASTLGRLYSSAFFALRDTRTPFRCAVLRIATTTILGYVCALHVPGWLGVDRAWGAAGLTASDGVAGWVEMWLLRRALNARIGETGLSRTYVVRLWVAAAVGAAVAWIIKVSISTDQPVIVAASTIAPYLLAFVGAAMWLGVADTLPSRLRVFRRT